MIIKKHTTKVSAAVNKIEGHGQKERQAELFRITVPAQHLIFNLQTQQLVDVPFHFELVWDGGNNPQMHPSKGAWALRTFDEFLSQINEVADIMAPYLKANLAFTGEAVITDDTHVWSLFKQEAVGGGLFKKGEQQLFQYINFEILGHQSGDVQWRADMMNPLQELRDNLLHQQQVFEREMQGLLTAKAATA